MSTQKDQYQLTPHNQNHERLELRFQRQMNNARYLTWARVLRAVEPDQTYRVKEFQSFNLQMTGQALLDEVYKRVQNRSCTFINSITRVDPDTLMDPREMWSTFTDPGSSRTLVENHYFNPWDLDSLMEDEPDLSQGPLALDPEDARSVAEKLVEHRAAERDCSDPSALEDGRRAAQRVIELSYPANIQAGRKETAALMLAIDRAQEAFDRAYCRARLENHGIDIDQHPRFHTYQYFYDLGMPPPTHEQMTDHIITTLTSETDGQDSRNP